jgi:glycosyltransferase involved in cell wall biosynthesis
MKTQESSLPGKSEREPRLTVVIPTFNAAGFLRECIRRLLCHGLPDLQVIVVDDGSTDDTPDVVRSFGPSVHYMHQTNAGPGVARNTGLAACRTPFVMFLDSDDSWIDGGPERLLELLERYPDVPAAFGDAQCGNDADGYASFIQTYTCQPFTELYRRTLESGVALVDGHKLFRQLLQRNVIFTGSVCWRREALQRLGGFGGSVSFGSEDWELAMRTSLQHDLLYCEGLDVARYVKHSTAMTTNVDLMNGSYIGALQQLLLKVQLTPEDRVLVEQTLAAQMSGWAYRAYDAGNLRTARQRYGECLRRFGFDPKIAAMWMMSSGPPALVRALRATRRRLAGESA